MEYSVKAFTCGVRVAGLSGNFSLSRGKWSTTQKGDAIHISVTKDNPLYVGCWFCLSRAGEVQSDPSFVGLGSPVFIQVSTHIIPLAFTTTNNITSDLRRNVTHGPTDCRDAELSTDR